MKFLLDTDTCINILRGKPAYVAKIREVAPDEVAISSITRYELQFGVARCDAKRRSTERAKVDLFLDAIHEIPFSREVADQAADIRDALERKGATVGPLDLLIAATARTANLDVITDNLREFSRVPRLRCVSWK